jgi:Putative restriction endonuclease
MATITTDPPVFLQALSSPPPRLLYRMSMEKYEAMVESGVFTKRDRFQLVEGLLVAIMTENPPHAIACELCSEVLKRVLPTGWHVRSDRPLRIPARTSVPEPDLVVARGEIRDYLKRHPEPVDVSLVIEVAASSLEEDRTLMARVYGGGGVARYWIINLVDHQVEVYSQPSGTAEPLGYRHCEIFRPGQSIPVVIDETEVARIAVAEILP